MQTRSSSKGSSGSDGEVSHGDHTTSAATPGNRSSSKNAHWDTKEITRLLAFFSEKEGEMTNGNAFKELVYLEAVNVISHLHVKGAKKDSSSISTKWKTVCVSVTAVPSVHRDSFTCGYWRGVVCRNRGSAFRRGRGQG